MKNKSSVHVKIQVPEKTEEFKRDQPQKEWGAILQLYQKGKKEGVCIFHKFSDRKLLKFQCKGCYVSL